MGRPWAGASVAVEASVGLGASVGLAGAWVGLGASVGLAGASVAAGAGALPPQAVSTMLNARNRTRTTFIFFIISFSYGVIKIIINSNRFILIATLILTVSRILHNTSRVLQRKGVELIASLLTNIMAFRVRRTMLVTPH
jgi:mannitol-specific phosphotransferase system IIBC component